MYPRSTSSAAHLPLAAGIALAAGLASPALAGQVSMLFRFQTGDVSSVSFLSRGPDGRVFRNTDTTPDVNGAFTLEYERLAAPHSGGVSVLMGDGSVRFLRIGALHLGDSGTVPVFASDYLLEIDGIKGESSDVPLPPIGLPINFVSGHSDALPRRMTLHAATRPLSSFSDEQLLGSLPFQPYTGVAENRDFFYMEFGDPLPAPGAAAFMGMGGLALVRRRRA